MLQAKKFKKRN